MSQCPCDRLSSIVETMDVAEANRLMNEAILSFAIDPLTGKIDMDLINIGKSSAYREYTNSVKDAILDQLSIAGKANGGSILEAIKSKLPNVNESVFKAAVEELQHEGQIYTSGYGLNAVIQK